MHLNRKLPLAMLAALSAGLVTACGGGGGYNGGNSPPAAKQAPTIAGLTDQSLPQDTSTPVLTFQVADADSGAGSVMVTASSSDASIVPAEGIVLGGSGSSRTLQITPAPEVFGDATITIRAVDPDGLAATQAIRVTVNGVFVSFTATVNDWFAIEENGDQHSLSGFTFTLDAEDNPTAFDALLQ
jgi:hypothetical protein